MFDYFSLVSITHKGAYDWILLNARSLTGKGSSVGGLLISPALKDIFCRFVLPEQTAFYPSKVMYRKQKYDYFLFQMVYQYHKHTILEKSSFQAVFLTKPREREFKPLEESVSSIEDFRHLFKDYSLRFPDFEDIHPKVLWLKEFADLVHISSPGHFMCSERLKQAIKAAGMKEFQFSPVEHIDFHFESV